LPQPKGAATQDLEVQGMNMEYGQVGIGKNVIVLIIFRRVN